MAAQKRSTISSRAVRGSKGSAPTTTASRSSSSMANDLDIAIVGMSCRLPGAGNLDEFWRNLAGGIESITRLSDRELLERGVPAAHLASPAYVRAAPLLQAPGGFDAAFFGYSPMEARTMDP